MSRKGALERGHIRAELIRELAKGELTQTELAERYGVTQSGVSHFAKRNTDAIQRAKDRLDDEFAALWIADKRNRLAEYQDHVDLVRGILADAEAGSSVPTAEMLRTAQSALKSVAEELGQLPARQLHHTGGLSVRYVVDGVNPEVLR